MSMTDPVMFAELPEVPVEGRRLGRHVYHDERSWLFPAPMAAQIVTVEHVTYGLPLDQGNTGSCTGNAATGLLNTAPFYKSTVYDEAYAVGVYSDATNLDSIPGSYPPDDTGSSGLAVAKVLKNRGLISKYRHAFGLKHALKSITLAPAMIGMAWLTGCDNPDAQGVISYTGAVRGGHEVLAVGLDAEKQLVHFMNSWGAGWGAGGRFSMSFSDFGVCLSNQGDVTVAGV